jgi:transcriptional regulator with XRE-family HTH domain
METAAALAPDLTMSRTGEAPAPADPAAAPSPAPPAQPASPASPTCAVPPARLRPRGGFGGYLHELRRERGFTIRHLAAGAGVHHTYVSKLERGDRQAPDEPVVEALAAALQATPAQLDQLRWRAGLTPKGQGAPGADDPTLTLVAEALGRPTLPDQVRDHLRQAIAQVVQAVAAGPAAPGAPGWAGGQPAAPGWPVSPTAPSPAAQPPAWSTPGTAPLPAASWPYPPAAPAGWIPQAPLPWPVVPGTQAAPAAATVPLPAPEPPADSRSALLAGLASSWQTLDEAAAELRVTPAYLLSLVQAGQLRAWSLPGAPAGSAVGLRVKREDLLALLQPVRV